MNYLREFLNFRRVWVASILKFIYLFFATLLTIGLWENTNDMRAILVNDKEAPDEEEIEE